MGPLGPVPQPPAAHSEAGEASMVQDAPVPNVQAMNVMAVEGNL